MNAIVTCPHCRKRRWTAVEIASWHAAARLAKAPSDLIAWAKSLCAWRSTAACVLYTRPDGMWS
jgi:hypothetical protein